jgi:hypothetical protein
MKLDETYFHDLVLRSCAIPIAVTHKWVASVTRAWLEGLTCASAVTLAATVPPRTNCTTLFDVTPEWVVPVRLAQLLCVIGHRTLFSFFLSFFLPLPLLSLRQLHWWFWSSIPYWKPVVPQINFMSWYPNHVGYVRHLYHLILLHFEIFTWMNSFVRDWRLNQCIFY